MNRETSDGAAADAPNRQSAIDAPIPLADGTLVPVRPILPDDQERLQRLHASLSPETVRYRFFGGKPTLSDSLARRFATVDGWKRWALGALDPRDPDSLVGVVHYDRGPRRDEAEFAIVLADRMQGTGLGRKLLLRLIDAARANGISHLYALVLADNKRMITVLKHLGVPYREKRHLDTERIWLDLAREGDALHASTGTPGESGHNQPGGATAPLTAREP